MKHRWFGKAHGQIAAVCVIAAFAFGAASARAEDKLPSRAEMWRVIQQQAKEIQALKKQGTATEKKVEATVATVEKNQTSGKGWWNRTQLGGYGEMHYNGGKKDELDFHRFVLLINHQFNSRIRLFSEIEVEHVIAGEGKGGEIELEQAWIEFDLTKSGTQRAIAGLFLIPVGILNETHEPTTFFGVERNLVETNIIPTTWWEGGGGFNGQLGSGFKYDLVVHGGLKVPTAGGKAFKIRDGRQKVSKSVAKDGAVTARVKWTGMPGVEIGVTAQYQADVTQDTAERVPAWLYEAHVNLRRGGWGLRALYARWDLNGSGPRAIGRDEQYGWYVEPSYRFETKVGEIGVFARYLEFDNEAGDGVNSKFGQVDFGFNYWPHPDVVLKFDYNLQWVPTGSTMDNRANLGLGFVF